jgi:SAM-dependent methyltransferase
MLFLRHVLAHAAPATGARVLDYGCGSGNVLRRFSAARDDLTLHGFDLDDRESSSLKRIRGFRDLYVGTLPEGSQFDIIVMSHSLEHLDDPVGSLDGIVGHLAPGGHLAVAVPDCELDAYKLLIADHCSHFSAVNLKTLLAAAGLHLGSIPTHVHSRELWAVAVAGAAAPTHGAGSFGDEWLAPSLVWLARVRDQARRLTAKGDVAVFGTSVSGMWMFAELGDAVCAFVDEDGARSGRLVHGRPILHPRDLPTSTRVLVPLPPPQGASIVRRLSPRGGEWHTLGDVVHPT